MNALEVISEKYKKFTNCFKRDKADILRTIGAYSLLTAGATLGLGLLVSTIIAGTSIGAATLAISCSTALAGYYCGGKFSKKIRKNKEKTRIATIASTAMVCVALTFAGTGGFKDKSTEVANEFNGATQSSNTHLVTDTPPMIASNLHSAATLGNH